MAYRSRAVKRWRQRIARNWNSNNPHVYFLVRAIAQDGSDLVVSPRAGWWFTRRFANATACACRTDTRAFPLRVMPSRSG